MKPVVTGIGWVNPGGSGRGRTPCARQPSGLEWPAGRLPKIRREDLFEMPYKDFGRMDAYSRLGLAAVALALKDGGLDEWSQKRPVGLIAATVYGCLHTDIAYYRTVVPHRGAQASPALFAYTLPNCFLGDAAIRFGLTGPAFVVNEPASAGLASLEMALESLYWGEAEQMLWGVCDLERPRELQRLKAAAAGALFFLLEAAPPANRPVYGNICLDGGSGVCFEGHRISSPVDLAKACLLEAVGTNGLGRRHDTGGP